MDIEAFSFASKILLFGEQTVLTGSQALSVPYDAYSGAWQYGEKVDPNLGQIVALLPKDIIDKNYFEQEVSKHLFFNSDIPQKAGLGSSGALSAALYKCFSRDINSTLQKIQQDLATIESVFHGKSSGTDALVSFANQSIHTLNDVSNLIDINLKDHAIYISLINSNKPRDSKHYIKLYLDKVEEGSINHQLLSVKSDAALSSFVLKDENFKSIIKELSVVQLKEFAAFIPNSILEFWEGGIADDSHFCKLCGAGGGGYFLCFSEEPLIEADDILPVNY